MRTLDGSPTASGLVGDVRLLLRLAGMLFQYWTAGRRLRRAYRRSEARGETFWLDDSEPTRQRGKRERAR